MVNNNEIKTAKAPVKASGLQLNKKTVRRVSKPQQVSGGSPAKNKKKKGINTNSKVTACEGKKMQVKMVSVNQNAVTPDVPGESAISNQEKTWLAPEIEVKIKKDNYLCGALLSEMAENGNTEAQCALGLLYYNGKGIKWDAKKAVELWSRAAEAGNAEAQYNLYCAHGSGRYFPQDFQNAMRWLRKAAENGCVQAKYDLSRAHSSGTYFSKDNEESMKWFRLSAEQGIAKRHLFLASPLYMDKEASKEAAWPIAVQTRDGKNLQKDSAHAA